jgi:integrase
MTLQSLKYHSWPAADKHLWERLTTPAHLLDDAGAGAAWAAETRRVLVRDYGYWLFFLTKSEPSTLSESPVSRVTRNRVLEYCRAMEGVSASTMVSRIARLGSMLRGETEADQLVWLADIRRRLEKAARRDGPARSKHERLVPTGKIVEVGLELMRGANGGRRRCARTHARRFRDGLMIALLAARPLRIKNFAGLRCGAHVLVTSSGYLIDVPGSETKTGHPIETFVPDELCPWLDDYLKRHRPALLRNGKTDYLWLNGAGNRYQPGGLSQRIAMLTRRHLGVSLSPHLFRDCAATTIATDAPEHTLIIALLLGHKTFNTTEKHYNHATCLDAARRYRQTVAALRSKSRRPLS